MQVPCLCRVSGRRIQVAQGLPGNLLWPGYDRLDINCK